MIKLYLDHSNGCSSGIQNVVDAQHKHLKDKVQFTRSKKDADVIACHNFTQTPVDVLHLHNFYFYDLPGKYSTVHGNINRRMLESIRLARYVTVPSEFIAYPLRRDLRIDPIIIPHGIDIENWDASKTKKSYILWNKNRDTDVCDTSPIEYLARAGYDTVSTFGYDGLSGTSTVFGSTKVTGVLKHAEMKKYIEEAGIYLATTPESFGIGVLEALAAGVPVLAYDWGNTPSIVRQGMEGCLVKSGDLLGLLAGCRYIFANYDELAANARIRAAEFSWDTPMQQYLELYEKAAEPEVFSISVVIEKSGKKGKLHEFPDTYEVLKTYNIPEAIEDASGDIIVVMQNSDTINADELEQLIDVVSDRKYDLVFPTKNPGLTNVGVIEAIELGIGIPTLAVFRKDLLQRSGGIRSTLQEFYARALSFGFLAGGIEVNRSTITNEYTSTNLDWLPWVKNKDFPVGFLAGYPTMLCSYTSPEVTVIISDVCDAVIMTLESLYVQNVPLDVVLTSTYELGIYKDFARVDENPVITSKYVMYLKAGEVLHPTALLEMLLEIEDFQYVCTDSRIDVGRHRDANGRKLLERVEGGTDWLYYPEVCWYTDDVMPCGSCGDRKRKKIYSANAKALRCIVPKATTYINRRKYRAVLGEEIQVSPEDIGALVETGSWEVVKPLPHNRTEPSEMIIRS